MSSAEQTPALVAMVSQEREFRKSSRVARHSGPERGRVGEISRKPAKCIMAIEHRSIYGEASSDQAKELHEEEDTSFAGTAGRATEHQCATVRADADHNRQHAQGFPPARRLFEH
jgi:hypothetical protein